MPAHIRSASGSGGWKSISSMFIRTVAGSGGWKNITQGWIRIAQGVGGWRQFFSSSVTPVIQTKVTIAKSSSNQYNDYHNPTFPVTLTGTRFHWIDANPGTFTYQFFSSADGINYTGIGTPTSTSNPSSGLSATNTYQLTTADFPSATMYFKFRFTATNTTFNTTAISESNPITVTYLDIPAPPLGFPRITQSTINAFSSGQSGTWIGSPTSYTWIWYFNDGLGLQILTYEAIKSITNKAISGTTATLTSNGHGFKSGDLVVISGVDALFNASPSIYSVTANTFSYTISKPAWSFTTNYSVNDYVSYNGSIYKAVGATPTPRAPYSAAAAYSANISYVNYNSQLYSAAQSVSSVSAWSSAVSYSLGTTVAFGDFRWVSELAPNQGQTPFVGSIYWSQINTNPSNPSYWTLINIYPNSTSYWQLQNFSTSSTGTATGPNYYEGTQSTPVTYDINPFPSSDYKTGQLLKNNTTVLSVTATNGIYTGSSSSAVRTIYGFPSIALQAPTFPSTTSASMAYTQSDTSVYDIDVKIEPTYTTSVSGYPKVNQPQSSPISITGLSSGTTYIAYVTPKNADSPRVSGFEQTRSFTTPDPAPTASGFARTDSTTTPSQPSTITFSSSNNQVTSSWTNGSPITSVNFAASGAGVNTNYTDTSAPFITSDLSNYSSSGTYTATVTNFNNNLQVTASWNQSGARSYIINYSSSVFGSGTVSGNNSGSSVSVPINWSSSSGSFTFQSVTLYSRDNQTGTSNTFNTGLTAVTPVEKSSSRTNSTSLTFVVPNLITNPAYGSSTSIGGGWTASISTQPNPTGGTYSVISQTAGSASVNSSTGALTASGLTASQSSTVTVRYSRSGYNPVDITASGTALGKLSTPTSVSATDTRTDGINITWQPVSGAGYYGVWYGPPAPTYDSLADFGGNRNTTLITGTSYFDNSMGGGVTRDYYVQAYRTGDPSGTKSEWGGPDSGTRVLPFQPPTCVAPSLNTQRLAGSQFIRWYCDYPTPTGNWTSITGMQFEIRTTAGGGTLLASNTRAYPGDFTYPYNVGGVGWAFKAGVDGQVSDIVYSSAARYLRARVVMLGTDGNTYNGTYSNWIVVPA